MTHQELKNKLISKIRETNNQNLLEDIFRMIENEDAEFGYYELSPAQQQIVEESMNDVSKGKYLTQKQADDEIEKWLKE